jgi:hypothetical protein
MGEACLHFAIPRARQRVAAAHDSMLAIPL